MNKKLQEKIEKEYAGKSICVTDAELELPGPKITYVSDGFTTLLGYSREEIIGKTPRLFQGPRTERSVLDRLKQELKETGFFQGSTINYRKDHTEFFMAWSIIAFRNEQGKVMNYIAIQTDATQTEIIANLARIAETQKNILEGLKSLEEFIGKKPPELKAEVPKENA